MAGRHAAWVATALRMQLVHRSALNALHESEAVAVGVGIAHAVVQQHCLPVDVLQHLGPLTSLESLRRTISKADCSGVPWGVEIILPFAKKVGSLQHGRDSIEKKIKKRTPYDGMHKVL